MDMTLIWVGAGLILLSILLIPISSRIGMPVLLLFLAIGMLAGEDGPGGIQFGNAEMAFLLANLALAVILLDGGMRTQSSVFRVGLRPATVLASFGTVVTACICGLAACFFLDLSLFGGLLVGAIICSTDAAAVFSLLQGRGLNINERVEATLEIESGSNDPMAVFLTLLLIEVVLGAQDLALPVVLLQLFQQFGLGALTGVASGYVVSMLVKKVDLTAALYPLMVSALGLFVFGATNALGGSGFLAIYLMGVTMAAQRVPRMPQILQVHDGLAWLSQVCLFLLLGLLVAPSDLLKTAPAAFGIALVLIFVARPLATVLSLAPFGFSWREHVFIAWVGLRGAVPIVLALFPLISGVPGSDTLFEVAFVVVLVSLLLQGSTMTALARWLKLEVPKDDSTQVRLEINQPAAGEHEILLVPLVGKRWQEPRLITDVLLPEGCVVAGVFKAGSLIAARPGLLVAVEDLVVVLSPRHLVSDVGHILGHKEPPQRLSEQRFFGEFILNGNAHIGDIEAAYGKTISRFESEKSLSECFGLSRHGHPVVGDRLDLGDLLLVVRAVDGDQVTQVGLKLRKD